MAVCFFITEIIIACEMAVQEQEVSTKRTNAYLSSISFKKRKTLASQEKNSSSKCTFMMAQARKINRVSQIFSLVAKHLRS